MAKKVKLDEAPKDEFVYERDHNKPMSVIAHELEEELKSKDKEEVVEKPVEEEKPEEKVTPPEEKPEEKVDVKEVAREAAKEATEQLKKEIDEIKGQNLSKKEEAEAIEDAKTKWTKEGRNPVDYDEIVVEAEERAVKRMTKFIEDREKAKEEESVKKTQEEEERVKNEETQKSTVLEQTQQTLAREIKELEDGGYIPKVVNESDDNDEGIRVRKALFQKGIEINNARIKSGELPENSIAKVFFMHFRGVNKQPAGADAPISGSRPAAVPASDEKPFIYARDHNKSFRQIIQEEKEKAGL